MAKATKAPPGNGEGPPDPKDHQAFQNWLNKQPGPWLITIAARAALRVVPLVRSTRELSAIVLPVFRATAVAGFAAKYQKRAIRPSFGSFDVYPAEVYAGRAAGAAAVAAAHSAYAYDDNGYVENDFDPEYRGYSAAKTVEKSAEVYKVRAPAAVSAMLAAVRHDAQQLHDGVLTPEQLARNPLWPISTPGEFADGWQRLSAELDELGHHWRVWIRWYQNILVHWGGTEAEDAAFTDIPGDLPWASGAEPVNNEIARRLAEISRPEESSEIPDQSPAPIMVEEREARVAKATDRDGALSASERDFRAWRDPVVDHIEELTASDFAFGTNHSRVRDRLMRLGKLLPGEIAVVKVQQFRIGYEIEQFEGLMAAYRSEGDDMPMLSAAQLEDLDRLRIALRMGVDKLERWAEFRKRAIESSAREGDADRDIVGDALEEMAAEMERQPRYFHPELPELFRFLAEAVRDPLGATRTVVYGAVKSAENVVSFLGQRALGIGKKGVEAVEGHISKAVAASLVTALGGAAFGISSSLPQGWAWLKPLLAALGAG